MQPVECKTKRHGFESCQDVNTGRVADASLILVVNRGTNKYSGNISDRTPKMLVSNRNLVNS